MNVGNRATERRPKNAGRSGGRAARQASRDWRPYWLSRSRQPYPFGHN